MNDKHPGVCRFFLYNCICSSFLRIKIRCIFLASSFFSSKLGQSFDILRLQIGHNFGDTVYCVNFCWLVRVLSKLVWLLPKLVWLLTKSCNANWGSSLCVKKFLSPQSHQIDKNITKFDVKIEKRL